MSRRETIAAFLKDTGWDDATTQPMAGDASSRRYSRLAHTRGTALLMDAPPQSCGSSAPFVRIAEHLRGHGFSAPEIYAADLESGLLLIEDFGDAQIAGLLRAQPADERRIYHKITDLLVALHACPPPEGQVAPDAVRLAIMIDPLFEYFSPEVSPETRRAARQALRQHLETLPSLTTTLALRDFHAENLMWLPRRTAHRSIGLLDFQDAIVTHPAYDLVSLIQDARRDVAAGLEPDLIARFCVGTGLAQADFEPGYAAIGLQRNLRILGIFCRLAAQAGKPRYLELLPRVLAHVHHGLDLCRSDDLAAAFAFLPKQVAP